MSKELDRNANVGNKGFLTSELSKGSLAKTTMSTPDPNIPQGSNSSLKAAMKALAHMHKEAK
jgi:hypothetical protein